MDEERQAMSTLIDLKKTKKITNKQIQEALHISAARAARILSGTYEGIMHMNTYQVTDLAQLFGIDPCAVLTALEETFKASKEERDQMQQENGMMYIGLLRRSFA